MMATMPGWREHAARTLRDLGIPERHTDEETRETHGHPGACCCWVQSCRSEVCNVNSLALLLRECEEGGDA